MLNKTRRLIIIKKVIIPFLNFPSLNMAGIKKLINEIKGRMLKVMKNGRSLPVILPVKFPNKISIGVFGEWVPVKNVQGIIKTKAIAGRL